MKQLSVLIIGNGGREHALAWKVAQSSQVAQVFVAPGNPGCAIEHKVRNVAINTSELQVLLDFAKKEQIDLTIVGPEQPLVDGIVDLFKQNGLTIFGPNKKAAQLEGSKSFAKHFLARHHIPTAAYQDFTQVAPALDYLKDKSFPIVIKADGLAAGKGVIIATDFEHAKQVVEDMLSHNRFGGAGAQIVIEDYLQGEEASFIVMVDSVTAGKEFALPMATSQDHKRIGDGDTGDNTGGMGAYSPAPVVTPDIEQRIMNEVIYPTIQNMAKEGMPYSGFLYAGLMIAEDGTPNVIEFNCRFGDPETQPIMMRLQSDLVDLCFAALDGHLDQKQVTWDPRPAIGVVLAAQNYPDTPKLDDEIKGIEQAQTETVKVFHSGTALKQGRLVTQGGRVLCVTGLGDTVAKAQTNVYQQIKKIDWFGCYYRKDIGYRAIERELRG